MQTTYELTLNFTKNTDGVQTKESVIHWLQDRGIESFVEGVIDDLDLDHEYGLPEPDYSELGGDFSPIILCSFDQNYISDLQRTLNESFSEVHVEHKEMSTDSWQNGWKDSFQVIDGDIFSVVPSWESVDPHKVCIRVEPGMAFGTGQHATSQVCLRALERLHRNRFDFENSSVLDVGTGTGILAIATAKLGSTKICATDIDKDALLAAKEHSVMNGVCFPIFEGSILPEQKFDLVIANILFKVLAPMMSELASAVNKGGHVILSGLIEEQVDEMLCLAAQQGLSFSFSENINGWVALVFTKTCIPKKIVDDICHRRR